MGKSWILIFKTLIFALKIFQQKSIMLDLVRKSKSIGVNANGNKISFIVELEHFFWFWFSIRFVFQNNEKVMII